MTIANDVLYFIYLKMNIHMQKDYQKRHFEYSKIPAGQRGYFDNL